MSEERRRLLSECVECRRPELRTAVIASLLKKSEARLLLDSDWRITYVFSSSQMDNINEVVAVFTLSLSTPQTLVLELTLSELDMLLQVLTDARSSITD